MGKIFRDFLLEVKAAGEGSQKSIEHLKTTGHLEEGQDSLGGFTVPDEVYGDVMAVSVEESIVRPRAQVLTLKKGDTLKVPTLVDTSHSSSVFGGITCVWTAEAVEKTEKNPAVGQIGLWLNKLVGWVYVSDELMDDSAIGIETFLRKAFGQAIAYYGDHAYINGTGVSQPLGILNAPGTISVAKESGQAADTLQIENIFKMASRLLPQSHKKAIWLANSDTLPQLGGLTANMRYIGPGFYVLGKEVIWTEKCQTLGDKGDIILADFSKYVIVDKGLQVDSSPDYSFNTDETCWRFVLRTDGQPILASAITPDNSTTTMSPFVTLAAR